MMKESFVFSVIISDISNFSKKVHGFIDTSRFTAVLVRLEFQ